MKSSWNVFRLLRIARDKKVKDLADELLVAPAYINAIENGTRYPSARLLRDYAVALGVSEEVILGFRPEEYENFESALLSLLQEICNGDT